MVLKIVDVHDALILMGCISVQPPVYIYITRHGMPPSVILFFSTLYINA